MSGSHDNTARQADRLRSQSQALRSAVNGEPLETSLGVLVRAAIDALGSDTRAAFYLANEDDSTLHHDRHV